MTGLPTLLVKLDDGSGSYPYDVSTFVRLPGGVSITRGRTDEFNQVQPSTLSLLFDNTTGVFTLGSGTYGIVIDQRIQVTETVSGAVKRFTGYVQDWPVAWPDGSDTFAVAQVTAVDRLSRLARRRLRSMLENEIVVDVPVRYYTLGEPEGSTSVGDTSGNGGPPLIFAGSGTAPVLGDATGPGTDELTALTLAGGQYLLGGLWQPTATSVTVEFAFLTAAAPASEMTLFSMVATQAASGVALTVTTAGKLQMRDATGATVGSSTTNSYADGATHWCSLTIAATTWTLYVDGTSVATGVGTAISTSFTYNLRLGAFPEITLLNLSGVLAHFAVYNSALSGARITSHVQAATTGFATDTADQRIARLASYGNIPTADQSLEVGQQPSIAAQSGGQVLQSMQDVSAAEGGLVFIGGDGKLVMQNKGHRVLKAIGTAALTLTVDQVDPDLAPGGAKSYLFNTATGTRNGGATQISVNSASVTAYEEYPTDLSEALLPSDELVLYILQWTTGKYGTPLPRIPALTIDLLTTASAVTAQAVLALEIGDLITITGLPSQSPASLGSLLVEGWTENLTHDSWTITLNTVPSSLFLAPVVDTAGATCDTGYPVYF